MTLYRGDRIGFDYAQDLLLSLKDAAAKVGLFLNAKKTEYIDDNHQPICSKDGNPINSRRSLILRSSAPLLQTARRTSYHVRDKHGMPVTSCIISGNRASQSPLNWLTSGLVWKVSFLWCRT